MQSLPASCRKLPGLVLVSGLTLFVADAALAQRVIGWPPIEPVGVDPVYDREATRLILREANSVATALQLPERLPITDRDITEKFISRTRFAEETGTLGEITTTGFRYYVSVDRKFSFLESTHQEADAWDWEKTPIVGVAETLTNTAYQLATQWLRAVSMDVDGLNRGHTLVVTPEPVTGGGEKLLASGVWRVYWLKDKEGNGSVASVRVFLPQRKLMQLRVEDTKYILRPRLPEISAKPSG